MKYLCLFLLLAGVSAGAQTNPAPTNAPPPFFCRQPYRVMGVGKMVDLTPLMQWWTNQGPQEVALPLNAARPVRPLSAWKRITGVPTGVVDAAWVVPAEIGNSPTDQTNEWILVKNPPVAEAAQYENLKALLVQYQNQIADDQRKQADYTKAAKQNTDLATQTGQSYSKSIRWNASYYTQLAGQNRAAAAAALADQKATEQLLEQARQLLKTIPSVDGRYQLDCFALPLGRNAKGQLIFDPGVGYGAGQ